MTHSPLVRRFGVWFTLMLLMLAGRLVAAQTQPIQFSAETLDNGLRVIYAPLRQAPVVHVRVAYHVGSRDERPDRQGFAHMFEHMMFRGSQHVKPEEHMKLIGVVGGWSNAYTSFDKTVYINTLPSNQLELALYLEADRMASFKVDEEIYQTERNVVAEEWRMRQNQPYGSVFEDILKQAFSVHPYRWTPIGDMDHLRAARVEELQDFFNTYYVPRNAMLIISGDIDVESTRPLVRRYFGWIPRGAPIERNIPEEPPLTAPKRIELTQAVPLAVAGMGWRVAAFGSEDREALSLLATILGEGRSSRIERLLVSSDDPLCLGAGAGHMELQDMGFFGVGGVVMAGKDPDQVEKMLADAIADIRQNGVTRDELEKARTQARIGLIHGRQTAESLADQLMEEALLAGDPGRVNQALAKLEAVTLDDIKAVANKYLQPQQALIVRVKPSLLAMATKKPPAKPDAAAPVAPSTRPVAARQVEFPPDYPKTPPVAGAQIPASFAKGQERTIRGVKVVIMPDHRLPLTTFTLAMRRGSHSQPAGKQGLGELTAELVRRGTTDLDYDALNQDLESRGISLSVGDAGDHTRITGSGTSEQLEHALQRTRQILLTPALPETELDKIKAQTINSLKLAQENPTSVGNNELRSAMMGDSPLGRITTPESVASITLEDVKNYYQRVYRPNDAILILSGDVTVERGTALAERLLAGWEPAPLPAVRYDLPPVPDERRIILVDRPDGKQSAIQIGIRAYTVESDEKFAGSIASQILTAGIESRLGRYVRAEKGLAYSVHGVFNPGRQAGAFIAGTDTSLETTADAVEAIFKVLEDMRNQPVTPEELAESKTRVAGSMVLGMQTIQQQAGRRLEGILNNYPLDYWDKYPTRISAVSADEIRQVMNKYVRTGQMTIVVVAPASAVKEQLERLGKVQVIPMPAKRKPDPPAAALKPAA